MPVAKDLKRLVRARMKKTGEAYTAASAQIIGKRFTRPAVSSIPIAPEPAPPAAAPPDAPSLADYASIAGMADAKVAAKTGRTWAQWLESLDRERAHELSHRDLARLLRDRYDVGPWWTQMLAVGYERIKGLRAKGQQRNGAYQVSKSRTFNVAVDELFGAWADATTRKRWLGDAGVRVRTATRPKSMRLEVGGAVVAAGFMPKGAGRSAVAVEQARLPSREAADAAQRQWGDRFDALKALLEP